MSMVRRHKWHHPCVIFVEDPLLIKALRIEKGWRCGPNDCGISCQTVETTHVFTHERTYEKPFLVTMSTSTNKHRYKTHNLQYVYSEVKQYRYIYLSTSKSVQLPLPSASRMLKVNQIQNEMLNDHCQQHHHLPPLWLASLSNDCNYRSTHSQSFTHYVWYNMIQKCIT